jgi:GNAT superfamily N-acetyltransferase
MTAVPVNSPVVRPARPEDVPAILGLVRDLAEYERALHEVRATEADLQQALFADGASVHAHVVEVDEGVVGFALWFRNFSTWLGTHGIYLEDLYVRPDQRGRGLGRRLLQELAAVCVAHGYGRLEWSCLDWNAPARGFYASLGAEPMEEWTVHRLTGDALRRVAQARGPQRVAGVSAR